MNFKPYCVLAFALYFGPFAWISSAEERATATAPISSMPDEDSDVDQGGLPKPDGLSNQDEALVGTDPLNPDSDDDELLDGAEAVPLSDKMKVAAARELRYAVVRLGPMKSALGVNSKGEVLLVDYGGSGTTQGYLWKDGFSQIIGTGLRGSFRGPMEDGTVYFATPTEETMFTDSFGLAVSFKSNLKAWKNGASAQAGLFYETNFWDNRQLPAFPTTHPTTEFLNEDVEGAYTSAWTAMKSAIPPAVPPNFAFSPQGYTSTTSSGGISRINDLGDKTYTFSANFSSPFSGPLGDSYSLPAQIELTGWMSLMPGFSAGEGYWKLNSPPEPNDTTNLPRDIMVNNGLRAVGRTNGGVIKWLVPGPNDIPIPNVSDIFDLNNSPNEGPYMLGSDSTGNLLLLCHGGSAFPRISLNGLGTISHDSEAVVSRKISDNLLIPADTGIWRNQRFRPLSEITSYDPNGQDYFTINQVSPTNDFLLGYGYFGDEQLHEGVLLVPCDLAVDSNRDGKIKFAGNTNEQSVSDKTTEAKPYIFWVNEDIDRDDSEKESGDSDWKDGLIQCARDLEDFARMKIFVGGLRDGFQLGKIRLGFEWKQTTGSPAVQVYPQVEESGGEGYLRDEDFAAAQVETGTGTGRWSFIAEGGATLIGPGEAKVFPSLAMSTVATRDFVNDGTIHLLFEACGEGKGQLCITIHDENGKKLGDGPGVWFDLKNIKKMYVRAKGTPENGIEAPFESDTNEPNPPPTGYVEDPNQNPFEEPHDEADSAVILVHGIHPPFYNSEDSYRANIIAAEIVFKRLWHQGFKGRFAFYKWPALNPAGFGTTGFEFNNSEYRAWKYGRGLAEFVNAIRKSSKNLYAHSQGNVVCGSALTVYKLRVNNYVLTQAAVPAGCYDVSGGPNDPTSINGYPRFWSIEATNPTPDSSSELGYRGYLSTLGVEGNVVNFHNRFDFALATGRTIGVLETHWEANQDSYKPDSSFSNANWYAYAPSQPNGQRCQLVDAVSVGRIVTDAHESMSLVARPRSKAVGARDSVQGSINNEFDLSSGNLDFNTSSDDHGGQVSRSIQQVWTYYNRLGRELEVIPIPE